MELKREAGMEKREIPHEFTFILGVWNFTKLCLPKIIPHKFIPHIPHVTLIFFNIEYSRVKFSQNCKIPSKLS